MSDIVKPTVNRQLFRRYKRGELGKEELADFLYSMAQVTLEEERRQMQLREEKYIHDTNRLVRAALCLVLHDKEGFGTKRLTRDLVGLHEIMDSYAKGYLSIEDMEETVERECGIKFKD